MTNDSIKTIELLRQVADKTDSIVAQNAVNSEEFRQAKEVAYQLFDEMLGSYCDGTMDWKESVDDLKANLMALTMPKPDAGDTSEGDGEDDGE